MRSPRFIVLFMTLALLASPFSALAQIQPARNQPEGTSTWPTMQAGTPLPLSDFGLEASNPANGALIVLAFECPPGVDPVNQPDACVTRVKVGGTYLENLADESKNTPPAKIQDFNLADDGLSYYGELSPATYRIHHPWLDTSYDRYFLDGTNAEEQFEIKPGMGTLLKIYFMVSEPNQSVAPTPDPNAPTPVPTPAIPYNPLFPQPDLSELIQCDYDFGCALIAQQDPLPQEDFALPTNGPEMGWLRVESYACEDGADPITSPERCQEPIALSNAAYVLHPEIGGDIYLIDNVTSEGINISEIALPASGYYIGDLNLDGYESVWVDGLNGDGLIDIWDQMVRIVKIFYLPSAPDTSAAQATPSAIIDPQCSFYVGRVVCGILGAEQVVPQADLQLPARTNTGWLQVKAYFCANGNSPLDAPQECQLQMSPASTARVVNIDDDDALPVSLSDGVNDPHDKTSTLGLPVGTYSLRDLEFGGYPSILVAGVGSDGFIHIRDQHATIVTIYYIQADPDGISTGSEPAPPVLPLVPVAETDLTLQNPGWGLVRVETYACPPGVNPFEDASTCTEPVDVGPDAWYENLSDPSQNGGNRSVSEQPISPDNLAYVIETVPGTYKLNNLTQPPYQDEAVLGVQADGSFEVQADMVTTVRVYYTHEVLPGQDEEVANPNIIGFGEQDIRPLSELNVWPGEGHVGTLIISAYECPAGVDPSVDASACTLMDFGLTAMWTSLSTDPADNYGERSIFLWPVSDDGLTRLISLEPGAYRLDDMEQDGYPFVMVQGVREDLTFDLEYAHGTTVKVYYLPADPRTDASAEATSAPAESTDRTLTIQPLSDLGLSTINPGWGLIRVQVYTCHRGAPAVVDRETCNYPVDINPDA